MFESLTARLGSAKKLQDSGVADCKDRNLLMQVGNFFWREARVVEELEKIQTFYGILMKILSEDRSNWYRHKWKEGCA